jgi:TrmH family RNA methyltransferase
LLEYILIEEHSYSRYNHLLTTINPEQIILLPQQLINKLNLSDSSIDLVAIIKIIPSPKLIVDSEQDYLLLEQIQDPGNLGTILRVAKASGLKNVLLSAQSVDLYNPKVLRASQGIQFGLNLYTNIDLFEFCTNYTGQIYALTPHANLSIYQQNLQKPTALVFGNEGSGISPQLLSHIQTHITIPMRGNAESLNLAMAVTASAFELSRQRL